MCQLVLLVVALLQCDEDAQVVSARNDANACASEFGAELVESFGLDTLLRAVDIEGGDRRVMRRLLGEI